MTAAEEGSPDSGAAISLPIRANGSGAAPTSSNALTGKQEHCRFLPQLSQRELVESISSTLKSQANHGVDIA